MANTPQLFPVKEFRSWDYSRPHSLICKNHPDLRWYWKGPGRNLHAPWNECPCPFEDLRVIVQPEDTEYAPE